MKAEHSAHGAEREESKSYEAWEVASNLAVWDIREAVELDLRGEATGDGCGWAVNARPDRGSATMSGRGAANVIPAGGQRNALATPE